MLSLALKKTKKTTETKKNPTFISFKRRADC